MIAATLFSAHVMLASFADIPELLIEEKDAEKIADAAAKVAALYDMGIDPRAAAWTNLAVTLAGVYGKRALTFYMRVKSEKSPAAS